MIHRTVSPRGGIVNKRLCCIGISIGRHWTGYAAGVCLDARKLEPKKFGLLDSGGSDLHKCADMITRTINSLKVVPDIERDGTYENVKDNYGSPASDSPIPSVKNDLEVYTPNAFVVGLQNNTLSSTGKKERLQEKSIWISKLTGIVQHDLYRLFKPPNKVIMILPREARMQLSVTDEGHTGRKKVFERVLMSIPSFPTIFHENGTLNESVYYISDAWASAHCAREQFFVDQEKNNQERWYRIKSHIIENNKQIRHLIAARDSSSNKRMWNDLEEVLKAKIEREAEKAVIRNIRKKLGVDLGVK